MTILTAILTTGKTLQQAVMIIWTVKRRTEPVGIMSGLNMSVSFWLGDFCFSCVNKKLSNYVPHSNNLFKIDVFISQSRIFPQFKRHILTTCNAFEVVK